MKISKLIIVSALAVLGLAQCAKESDQESLGFNFEVTPLGELKGLENESVINSVVNHPTELKFHFSADYDIAKEPIKYEISFPSSYIKRNLFIKDSLYERVIANIKGSINDLKDTLLIKYTPLDDVLDSDLLIFHFYNEKGFKKDYKYYFKAVRTNSKVILKNKISDFFEYQKVDFPIEIIDTENSEKGKSISEKKYFIRFDKYDGEDVLPNYVHLSLNGEDKILNEWYPIDKSAIISLIDTKNSKTKDNQYRTKKLNYSIKNDSGKEIYESIDFKVKLSEFLDSSSFKIVSENRFDLEKGVFRRGYNYKFILEPKLEFFSGNEKVFFKIEKYIGDDPRESQLLVGGNEFPFYFSSENKSLSNPFANYRGYLYEENKWIELNYSDVSNFSQTFFIHFLTSNFYANLNNNSFPLKVTFKTDKGAIKTVVFNGVHVFREINLKNIRTYNYRHRHDNGWETDSYEDKLFVGFDYSIDGKVVSESDYLIEFELSAFHDRDSKWLQENLDYHERFKSLSLLEFKNLLKNENNGEWVNVTKIFDRGNSVGNSSAVYVSPSILSIKIYRLEYGEKKIVFREGVRL